MADYTEKEGPELGKVENEGGDQIAVKGNEWEVVSLTASTYAASPGPKAPGAVPEEKGSAADESQAQTSQALFMSGHFVYVPGQHMSSPAEEEDQEMHKEEKGGDGLVSELQKEKGDRSKQKEKDDLSIPGLKVPEEFAISEGFDGKAGGLPINDSKFGEMTLLHGAKAMDVEQVIYDSVKNNEIILGGSTNPDDHIGQSESALDPVLPQSENSRKDDKSDEDDSEDLLSTAWWKKPMACFRAHVNETNAFWSIFIAAAVVGLVILGQKWQQEKKQVLQQRLQLSLTTEKPDKAVGSLSRFKDIMVGGGRHASYASNGVSAHTGR